jgi:hypothetical protein
LLDEYNTQGGELDSSVMTINTTNIANKNYTNTNTHSNFLLNNKKVYFILLKITTNFLAKLTETQTIEKIKSDLSSLSSTFTKFIEIDDELLIDVNNLLINEIIKN